MKVNEKNLYSGITIVLLSLILCISLIIYPQTNSELQSVETMGEVSIDDEFDFYFSHTIEFNISDDGDWYFDGNSTYLQNYRIITHYNITIDKDIANLTEDMLIDGDAFLTLNITLSTYDRNEEEYVLYDDPVVYHSIEINKDDVDLYEREENYTISGMYSSDWISPAEFNGAYQLIYLFSTSYNFLLVSHENQSFFQSEIYLAPFDFIMRYNTSKIVPSWWIWTSVIIGSAAAIIGYLLKSGKFSVKKSFNPKIGKNITHKL